MTKSSTWSVCNAPPLLTDGYRKTICDQILTIFCEPCTEKHVLVILRWGKDTLPGTSLQSSVYDCTCNAGDLGWIPSWGTEISACHMAQPKKYKEKGTFHVGMVSKGSYENTSPFSIFKQRILIIWAGDSV